MINDRTSRNYPLPHPENIAKHDVVRMREAFIAVDADICEMESGYLGLIADKNREKFEKFIGLWRNNVG